MITATTNAINPVIKWYKDTELITGENTLSLNVMLSGTYEVVITGGLLHVMLENLSKSLSIPDLPLIWAMTVPYAKVTCFRC
ncbi:MAG: hypothetical protein IPP49_06365 [Saprospiraceae bacterium]|nr:hypothetical protein [Saprospiraceae bacterium]